MMSVRPNLLQGVIDSIDQYNSKDERTAEVNGKPVPFEVAFSERLSGWVLNLAPEASESLRIAARGQHIGRWTIPRNSYPMDRSGYLRWRGELKKFHAQKAGEVMAECGYPSDAVEKVRNIILKQNLKDPDTQTLEDALCLEFLENQFTDLKSKTSDDKMKDIVRKTWNKMSERAHGIAVGLLNPDDLDWTKKALGL